MLLMFATQLPLRQTATVLFIHSFQVHTTGTSMAQKAGRNAAITSLMVCCGFIACWSLNQIMFFLNFVGYAVDFGGWFYHLTNYQ